MPNPWVIAALAGFSVVAFIVYLSEFDQPPLAPPHYQYARGGNQSRGRRSGQPNQSNSANSKKDDDAHKRAKDDDESDDDDSERSPSRHGRGNDRQEPVATTITSGAHRFPGSVGTGSMMVRRRSRTISSGSRQEASPSFGSLTRPTTHEHPSPPPPAYAPSASHLERSIELKPLLSLPPTTNTTSTHTHHEEALALASELEATERQLQALLLKREQLALRQSQIDLRELAAQQQRQSFSSALTTDSIMTDAPNPFSTTDDVNGTNELEKMHGSVQVPESAASESARSSEFGSLVSVPKVASSEDRESDNKHGEPVSPSTSTSGFDSSLSSPSRFESRAASHKDDSADVEITACEQGLGQAEDEKAAVDTRSESEFSLVSAGSA
ncbi:hypothetical protein BCR44DRAFT_47460 [Catenaria anguillulae PL171]|uniref:Uncharacterized protein n=1 Tax=Catenaria anguillulae PL171 TaxID=765915 RepID=A0A1Y2HUV1_9FUNG|nr:hypothetical protein BCR44DRAFT_47460 [Catenaria anguillulae PL171]